MASNVRRLGLAGSIACCVAIAGCGGDDPQPEDSGPNTNRDGGPGNMDATAEGAPNILEFAATSTTVGPGARARLYWRTEDAVTVTLSAAPGGDLLVDSSDVNKPRAEAYDSMPLTQSTKFTLVAKNAKGETDTATVDVIVNSEQCSIISFEANPNPVMINSTTNFSWQTINCNRVRIRRNNMEFYANVDMVDQGSVGVTITSTVTTFQLIAEKLMDDMVLETDMSDPLMVIGTSMGDPPPTILDFDCLPRVFMGTNQAITINWATQRAESWILKANGQTQAGFPQMDSGMFTLTATRTTHYELTVTNTGGMDTRTCSVHNEFEDEPNGTPRDADFIASSLMRGRISPPGDVDWYWVDVPAGGFISAFTHDGAGSCSLDTAITIYDSMTMFVAENDEGGNPIPGGTGRCSRIDPQTDERVISLAGGRYYVEVRGFGGTGQYVLTVNVGAPRCGNTVVEVARGEQCDDGNMTAGDGCDNNCQIEAEGTVQGPGSTQTFMGSLQAGGRHDYVVVLSSPGYIRAQTFVPTAPTCTGPNNDTNLTLKSTTAILDMNDNWPDGQKCSLIDVAFPDQVRPAGVYKIEVHAFQRITAYSVRIDTLGVACGNGIQEANEQCDDGNTQGGDLCDPTCNFTGASEAEPNNTTQNATAIGTARAIRGSLGPAAGDVDCFRLMVPAGNHIETYVTVNSLRLCPRDRLTQISLFDPTGTGLIASDFFHGPNGSCGRIAPDTTQAALSLAGGQYYICVSEMLMRPVSSYVLHVRVFAPGCGNGLLENNEQCDDGNTAAMDGCDATCRYEIQPTVVNGPPGGRQSFSLGAAIGASRTVRVNITAPGQSITATTSDGSAQLGCPGDTAIELFDDQFARIGRLKRQNGNNPSCGGIQWPFDFWARDLEAGTYYLKISNEIATPYTVTLDVGVLAPACGNGVPEFNAGETCDDGDTINTGNGCTATCQLESRIVTETEPSNNNRNMAVPTGATRTTAATVFGRVEPDNDVDYWSFDVPSGATVDLTATIYGNLATIMSCEGDTYLTLLDQAGSTLAQNDDFFQVCSKIDGSGMAPSHPGAQNLQPGRYYLKVESHANADEVPVYFMDVQLVP